MDDSRVDTSPKCHKRSLWQVMLILSHSCINFNCAIFVILLLHSPISSRNNHTLCYRFLYQCLNLRTLFKRQYRSSLLVHILSIMVVNSFSQNSLFSAFCLVAGGQSTVRIPLVLQCRFLPYLATTIASAGAQAGTRENLTNSNLTQALERTPKPLNHGGTEVRPASGPWQG